MSLRIPSSPRGQRCCRLAETDRNHTCSLGVPGSLSYYISTSNHVSKKLPELPKNIQSVTSGKNTYIIYMLCVLVNININTYITGTHLPIKKSVLAVGTL